MPSVPTPLRKSSSPMIPHHIRPARLRSLDRRLQCVLSWVLSCAVGCWPAEWCRCRASRAGLDHTTSVKHVASSLTRKAYGPVPELESSIAYPAPHSFHISETGTGARRVPGSSLCLLGGFSRWRISIWSARPTVVRCDSSPSTFRARLFPIPASPPPALYPRSLLASRFVPSLRPLCPLHPCCSHRERVASKEV